VGGEISDFCLNTPDEVASAFGVDAPTALNSPNPGFGGGCLYNTANTMVYSIGIVPANAGGVDTMAAAKQTPGAVEIDGIGEDAVLMSAQGPLVYKKGDWIVSTGGGLEQIEMDPAAYRTALETLARAGVDRF
jgi:hypothetical protein